MTPAPSRESLQQRIYRELADALRARIEGQELSHSTGFSGGTCQALTESLRT
jgi:hypothetical protein